MVDAIRATFTTAGAPAGLQIHLTGQLATQIDTIAATGSSQDQTSQLSLLFIVVLLLLAFRAVLAPLITLIPAAFVLVLSGPVIAEATNIGVQVSSITQLLLIVLILGAGTDYGVFLVFRVREELRRGLTPQEAVVRSVSRVGESITFSAFTVIAALMSLVLAEFAFYQSLGPALAIGIALMLLAGLTLLPALLAIFGRAVFWPTGTAMRHEDRAGLWDRIGVIVTRRPGITLTAGVALFVGPWGDAPDDRRGGLRRRRAPAPAAPTPRPGRPSSRPTSPPRSPGAAPSSCSSRRPYGTTRRCSPGPDRPGPGGRVQRPRRSPEPERHPPHDRPAGRSSTRRSARPGSCRRSRPRTPCRPRSTTPTGRRPSSSAPTGARSSSRWPSRAATHRARPPWTPCRRCAPTSTAWPMRRAPRPPASSATPPSPMT